jgi:acyl carrier protein
LENSLQVIGSSVLDAPPAAATAGQQEEERFIRKALMTIDKAPARHALLAVYLQEQVARLLRLSVSQVDLQQSLGALGLDALGAVELKYDLQTSLGVVLPRVDALQGLSISQLVPNIVEALDAPAGAPAAMVKTTPAR